MTAFSPDTLVALSQPLYELDFFTSGDRPAYQIFTHREVRGMQRAPGGDYTLYVRDGMHESDELCSADVVILATGHRYGLPGCLVSLAAGLERDEHGLPALREDHSVAGAGPAGNRIYMQNLEALRRHERMEAP